MSESLAILAKRSVAQQDVPAQGHNAAGWATLARVLGVLGLILAAIYFFTALLPEWFGYLLGLLGLAAWLSLAQSRNQRREP